MRTPVPTVVPLAGTRVWLTLTAAAALLVSTIATQGPSAQPAMARWFKGNTHTHTINSDGDSTPDEVVRWYREHGYNFLVLSDHNYLTATDGLGAVFGAPGQFILIRGEEVTDSFEKKPIHVNGLDLAETVAPQHGDGITSTIQNNVDAIRAARGVPHVNHPNFLWAIGADHLKAVRNLRLFEIYNGHPEVNNLGGGGFPGLEAMWDDILSSGILLYGIAVDDAHHFKTPGDRTKATPGRGWVVVRAPRLEAGEILRAMERGDFYASTGVVLKDYEVDDAGMRVTIAPAGQTKYSVQFVGKGGAVLAEATGNPAIYAFTGEEAYVRARIRDSNGGMAWTQPVMHRRPAGPSR